MSINEILIRLAIAQGIGPRTIMRICQVPEWHRVIQENSARLVKAFGITVARADKVVDALKNDDAYLRHTQWCKSSGGQAITIMDSEYPELLSHIAVPPPVLWVRGNLEAIGESLLCAFVGARAITPYAHRVIKKIITPLVSVGFTTVSGGARGVDSAVHRVSLALGGKTIVVTGSGLAHVYPPEHRELFEEIISNNGLILSPFAPWVAPSKGTFPERNRIIAGLTSMCVVVQAASRSGALITAEHALNENRIVGAVPGHIDDHRFEGSNTILHQGAVVIRHAGDIMNQFGIAPEVPTEKAGTTCSSSEQRILDLLDQPQTFDDLRAAGHTDLSELQALLHALETKGKIKQNFAGFWERHE